MIINFRLINADEIDKCKRLLTQLGQSRSDLFRGMLMSYTPPPSKIDLNAYIALSQIISELKKTIDKNVINDTNTELLSALAIVHDLVNQLLIPLNEPIEK